MKDLLSILEGKWGDGTRPADLYADHVAARPGAYVDAILAGLASKQKRVRAGCGELASLVSADHPAVLYPHVARFVENLRAKAPIVRWEAVCTLGNLATVDDDGVIAKHVGELIAMLSDKSIVLQGHAVRALAKLAVRHRELAARIWKALLASEPQFPGTRVGYLVEASELLAGDPALVSSIRRFLSSHAASERAPVARKATRVLRKLDARADRPRSTPRR
jgi:hypothetical protein